MVATASDGFELRYGDSAFPLAQGTAATPGPVVPRNSRTRSTTSSRLLHDRVRAAQLPTLLRRLIAGGCSRRGSGGLRLAVLARALELVDDGTVDGLRIDHIDGLRDPAGFADRLRSAVPGAWLIAEKILATGEQLPATGRSTAPPGTSSDALLTSLMVRPDGLAELVRLLPEFTGDRDRLPGALAPGAPRDPGSAVQRRARAGSHALPSAPESQAREPNWSSSSPACLGTGSIRRMVARCRPTTSERSMPPRTWARESGRCDGRRLDAILAVLRGDGGGSANGP